MRKSLELHLYLICDNNNLMFLKRAFAFAKRYTSTLKQLSITYTMRRRASQISRNLIRSSPIMFFVASTIATCIEDTGDNQPQIHEVSKQQLVQFLHQEQPHEFIVIIYDKFKRLNEEQFGKALKPIIEECKSAKIGKVYLIDSKEKEHLNQIVRMLKNKPQVMDEDEVDTSDQKKKEFQSFYKCKFFNEAIQLERINDHPISKQINQIRHFQFVPNNEKINDILANHMASPFSLNKSYVVKQCPNEGECVESYKRQIKKLIDGGMLNSKTHQYSFELILDHPTGILGNSSEFVKSFIKSTEKLKEKNISPNRKEETYIFRHDLLGNQVSLFSEWLDKEGLNYSANDRFLMFIRPRINIISIANTLTDLMWYLRAAKLNNQVSLSLNNIHRYRQSNSKESLEVLKILHQNFPNLNYLIINSEKISELVRHVNADYKYVVFKQESNVIWNKQFLDLDKLQALPTKTEKENAFNAEFKQKIDSFIDNPQVKNFVEVDKQMQVNLEKLRNLRDRQLSKANLKKYIVRVCKDNCYRYLDQKTLDSIKQKLAEPVNVYWIDSRAQNIGVEDGDYILKDGKLTPTQQFLSTN